MSCHAPGPYCWCGRSHIWMSTLPCRGASSRFGVRGRHWVGGLCGGAYATITTTKTTERAFGAAAEVQIHVPASQAARTHQHSQHTKPTRARTATQTYTHANTANTQSEHAKLTCTANTDIHAHKATDTHIKQGQTTPYRGNTHTHTQAQPTHRAKTRAHGQIGRAHV